MSAVTWMDPAAVVLLHHFAFRAEGGPLVYMEPVNRGAREFVGMHTGVLEVSSKARKRREARAYPSKVVERESEVIPSVERWEDQVLREGMLSPQRASQLSNALAEVLTNSFQHGQGGRSQCIMAGQIFKTTGHSQVAAADFGRTIPGTLRDSGRYPDGRPAHEWIEFATRAAVTARSRETNRGSGLYMLKERVRADGGTMIILSGDGVYELSGDGEKYEPIGVGRPPFPGTFVILDLPKEVLR